jgi:hypothetical protein
MKKSTVPREKMSTAWEYTPDDTSGALCRAVPASEQRDDVACIMTAIEKW